ncbi:MAG: hypothetical protein Q4G11_02400 [Gallicola sp.]|nr:hypothetical protein [Gallicola sp.]
MKDSSKKKLNRISLLITLAVLFSAIYIMKQGFGVEGKDYGSGAYYYSDIPYWEDVFYNKQ